jgi:hypothetical protein
VLAQNRHNIAESANAVTESGNDVVIRFPASREVNGYDCPFILFHPSMPHLSHCESFTMMSIKFLFFSDRKCFLHASFAQEFSSRTRFVEEQRRSRRNAGAIVEVATV